MSSLLVTLNAMRLLSNEWCVRELFSMYIDLILLNILDFHQNSWHILG
jgi:hypothetical protein